MSSAPQVITGGSNLARVVEAAAAAPLLAVDVEGNGLFAYRSRLCTVQLAWQQDGETHIAIVDTLALDPAPLRALLSAEGPIKVLHDFTFDIKLLAEAGIVLANLRDTSVLARMLGRKSTGLASLLSSELGLVVPKELQQHDWSRRPLRPVELEYLATDVRHLAALYEKLSAHARSLDIEEEVIAECEFKYDAALAPPRERRPAYLRIKGAESLDGPSLAVLRRLVEEREQLAALWDQPPFKVVGNDVLLWLAQRKPATVRELESAPRGISERLLNVAPRFVGAILAGQADGSVPPGEWSNGARPDRALLAARRSREKRLSNWRRKEAAARGVDEQVVLPGHCLAELVALETNAADAIARVKGMGPRRIARYGAILSTLLADAPLHGSTGDANPESESPR
ncbi:MAG TPA: HRDC domain-containing protein [Polyangiaceae bacterium]